MANRVMHNCGYPMRLKHWMGPWYSSWHGTGGSPLEAPSAIGEGNAAAIKALGGMVIAPVHDPEAGVWPWFLTDAIGPDDDVRLADELLACAIQKVGVDMRHIHSMGGSAGALQTTEMSYRRSVYLASVVTLSGGLHGSPPNQDPSNKVAAMITHGGASDGDNGYFQVISEAYRDDLKKNGSFAFICNHNNGHAAVHDQVSKNSIYDFFMDNPFGVYPSPYEKGLPPSFPSYCEGSTAVIYTSVPQGGAATLDGNSPILIKNTAGTLTWVSVVHPAFNEAIHLDTTNPTGDIWNGHFLLPLTRNIEKGDEILIHTWFRKVSAPGDTGSGSIWLILDSTTENASQANLQLTSNGEWQEFFMPITMREALKAEGHFLKFAFGAGTTPQVLELGSIEILNYGAKSTSSLP